tara:strand:- start:167 stop:712 length:546 start_codon:yes stop_codon:yes gene_type:complete
MQPKGETTSPNAPSPAKPKRGKKEQEARTWAWVSLVFGTLIAFGALFSGALPVILVELSSILGSAFFLFGSERLKQTGVTLLMVSAVFELVAGGVTLLFALYFIAVPGVFAGFGLLLGIYALVFSVPILALGAIDYYTVRLVRKRVFGSNESKGYESGTTETKTLMADQGTNLPPMDALKV